MYPKSYQKLIKRFLKFPTVGPRTAARFVSYLIHESEEDTKKLLESIEELKREIKLCSFCFSPFDDQKENNLCEVCRDEKRNDKLCIVEKEIDLFSIEKTKKYKGIYFILGGTITSFTKRDLKKLRTEELKRRIKNPKNFGIKNEKFEEVIIATNPTPEGEAASSLVKEVIKKTSPEIKITQLGRGLPKGGELEYADEETLSEAFQGRK